MTSVAGSRSALIVACSSYEDNGLAMLRAPAQDAKALADVLGNPNIGEFDVTLAIDQPEAIVRRKVAAFFGNRSPEDTLLLHFSCHGVKDDSGQLYFAAADTELATLDATAVPAEFVDRQMNKCRSRRIILLLDCCYSGAFARGMTHRANTSLDLQDRFEGRGRMVLTASSSMEYSFEGDTLAQANGRPSIFTNAIVEGLRTGEADRDHDGYISVDELYDYVYERVRSETPAQTPRRWAFDIEGDLILATAVGPVAAELPEHLQDALRSPFPGARLDAISELERLLTGRHRGLVEAARSQLQRLTQDDDSLRVQRRAGDVLRAHGGESRTSLPNTPQADAAAIAESAESTVEQGSPTNDLTAAIDRTHELGDADIQDDSAAHRVHSDAETLAADLLERQDVEGTGEGNSQLALPEASDIEGQPSATRSEPNDGRQVEPSDADSVVRRTSKPTTSARSTTISGASSGPIRAKDEMPKLPSKGGVGERRITRIQKRVSKRAKILIGIASAAVALTVIIILVATSNGGSASGRGSGSSAGGIAAGSFGRVGVILPDETTSPRYIAYDKPLLTQAFAAAGITADIQNAQGDKTKFATTADSMIQSGVAVLITDGLDSPSAAAVQQKTKAAGIKTIDYDRLTLGGSSDYYVSFDNVAVGKLQGEGLVACLDKTGKQTPAIAELNGSPNDNNATLFAQGYNSVLDPLYASGKYKKAGNQSVPAWDKDKAVTFFQGMFTAAGGNIDGVLAANDTLGNAAITILKQNGKTVPVTGQDATVQGLQNILTGHQCMTVFKDVKKEAQAAAALAIALLKGQSPESAGVNQKVHDPTGNRDVPSVLLTPVAVTKANIKTVTDTGEVSVAVVCKGYQAQCKAAGIQ